MRATPLTVEELVGEADAAIQLIKATDLESPELLTRYAHACIELAHLKLSILEPVEREYAKPDLAYTEGPKV